MTTGWTNTRVWHAYNSILRLTLPGLRSYVNGQTVNNISVSALYVSRSPSAERAFALSAASTYVSTSGSTAIRALGSSKRCIKD